MDIQSLLLNANGRVAQQDYWVGVLIIIAGNVIAGFVPLLGTLISLALIYVGICVYGKRLHDIGKSAWLHVVPWAVTLLLWGVGFMMVGGAILSMILNDEADPLTIISAGGGILMVMGINTLVWLGYTVWLGTARGEDGANEYGPAPAVDGTINVTPNEDASE